MSAVLISMLNDCEKQFRYYAEQHSAKGTVDGATKAQVNLEFAMRIRNAIASHQHGARVRLADFDDGK